MVTGVRVVTDLTTLNFVVKFANFIVVFLTEVISVTFIIKVTDVTMVVNMIVVTSVTKDASFPSVMFIVARLPPPQGVVET
jgi:hypothetical protein